MEKIILLESTGTGTDELTVTLSEGQNYTGASAKLSVDSFYLDIDPVLENNTWEKIADVAASGFAREAWDIGDTKNFNIGNTTYAARIVGFNHDDLAPSDAKYSDSHYNGGTKKAGITFEMVDCANGTATIYCTDSSSTYGQAETYRGSKAREYAISNYNSVYDELKPYIRTVNKKTCTSQTDETLIITEDNLFVPAMCEIRPSSMGATGSYEEGTRYEYWEDKVSLEYLDKKYNGETYSWWTRSPSIIRLSQGIGDEDCQMHAFYYEYGGYTEISQALWNGTADALSFMFCL